MSCLFRVSPSSILIRGGLARYGRAGPEPASECRGDLLIQRRGRVMSREQLLEAAWDRDIHVTDRAVDAHIVNLRMKIESHPADPRFLLSVRGLGYRFDA